MNRYCTLRADAGAEDPAQRVQCLDNDRTPGAAGAGSRSRPVDQLHNPPLLNDALATFADTYWPVEKRR